jgi:predicted permease
MDKEFITQVIILFLIMAIGYISRKQRILNPDRNKGLAELLLKVTLPCLVVSSFQFTFSQKMLAEAGIVLAFSLLMHLLTIFLGKILFNRSIFEGISEILRLSIIFTNGVLCCSIIGSIFGARGIFFMSLYYAIDTIFVWTYGIFIFTGKAERHSLTKVFFNPGIVSVFLGLLLFLFSLKLPLLFAKTLQSVGSISMPLSMILLGSTLVDVKMEDLFSSWPLYYGALIRLLLIPILTLFSLKWLNFRGILLGVCVLVVAVPTAVTIVPLAENKDGDVLFASRIVFITTILSIFTIPLVIWLF